MKIHLLGIGSETLLSDFESAGIEFSRNRPPLGEPMNSGSSIEIAALVKDAVPWAAIASVLVAWLRARASRKVILTLDDNKTFHAEGMSVEEVQRLLARARYVNALETKKPGQGETNSVGGSTSTIRPSVTLPEISQTSTFPTKRIPPSSGH